MGRLRLICLTSMFLFLNCPLASAAEIGSDCNSPLSLGWSSSSIQGVTVAHDASEAVACGSNRTNGGMVSWYRGTTVENAKLRITAPAGTWAYVFTSANGSCANLQCVFSVTAAEGSRTLPRGTVVFLAVSTGLHAANFSLQLRVDKVFNPMGECSSSPLTALGPATSLSFEGTKDDMQMADVPRCPNYVPGPARVAWFLFTTEQEATYTFEVVHTTFESVLHLASAPNSSCSDLTCLIYDRGGGRGDNYSRLVQTLLPNVTYYLALSGWASTTGNYTLAVDYGVTELTGSCSRTQTVLLASNSSVSFHRTPADMQISTVPTCPQWSDTGGAHVAWFKFETPMDQSYYSFDIINATFDTVFHLASSVDGTCGAMSCVTMNDNGGASGGLSRLIMSLPKGMMYFLAVHGKQGAVGEFDLVVTAGETEVVCFGAKPMQVGIPFTLSTMDIVPETITCDKEQVPRARINWFYGRVPTTGEYALEVQNMTTSTPIYVAILYASRNSVCDNLRCGISGLLLEAGKPRKDNITAGTVSYFAFYTDAREANSTGNEFTILTMGPPQQSVTSSGGRRVLLIALLAALLGAAGLLVGSALVLRRLFFSSPKNNEALEEFLRKRNPPQQGMPMAAIITDIEGSTSLWEWNPAVMKKALAIHHNVCRLLLPKFHGYESDTEGDSFTLVFHDALDALGWAMEVQRHLLFPLNLFHHMGPQSGGGSLSVSHSRASGASRSHGEEAYSDWPKELLSYGTGTEVADPTNGNRVLYRGLRVRMGIHIGVPESIVPHVNGRQHYKGEVMEMTKAVQDAAASGGQVLMSMCAWQAVGIHYPAIICHHMGLHEVGEKLPPVHIMQVVPVEMAHRAPFLPLKSKQLTPSFFDAPCAVDCYVHLRTPSDPIVICFMYISNAKTLRRRPGYQVCIELLVNLVQGLQRRYHGYEVEEKDGNYLLAFRSAASAAHFAEAVQREAMTLAWSEDILEQEGAAEVLKPATGSNGAALPDVVVFRGLRMQIGMCMDVPSDCQPHVATGRAAYFGPIVNRAARIAATAACGQTLANVELVEAAKGECRDLLFQEMGKFDLKGVKEPMHLFQVFSSALSSRLFPRTRCLAKFLTNNVGLCESDEPPGSLHDADGTAPAPEGSVSIGITPINVRSPREGSPLLPNTPISRTPSRARGSNHSDDGEVRKFHRTSSRSPWGTSRNLVSYDLSLVDEDDDEPDYSDLLLDELVTLVKRYRGEVRALRDLLAQNRRA